MEYEVKIDINGQAQLFVFKLMTNDLGRLFKVESRGRWCIMDKTFLPIAGDMPKEWYEPMVEELRRVLGDKL